DPDTVCRAVAPPWLLDRLQTRTADRLRADATPMVLREGERNQRLFQLGSALRRYGLDETAVRGGLEVANPQHPAPPRPGRAVAARGRRGRGDRGERSALPPGPAASHGSGCRGRPGDGRGVGRARRPDESRAGALVTGDDGRLVRR